MQRLVGSLSAFSEQRGQGPGFQEDDSRQIQPDRSVDRELLIQALKQHIYYHSEHFAQVTLWVLALSKAD